MKLIIKDGFVTMMSLDKIEEEGGRRVQIKRKGDMGEKMFQITNALSSIAIGIIVDVLARNIKRGKKSKIEAQKVIKTTFANMLKDANEQLERALNES